MATTSDTRHTENGAGQQIKTPREWTVDSRTENTVVVFNRSMGCAVRAIQTGGRWMADVVDSDGNAHDGSEPVGSVQDAISTAVERAGKLPD